MFNPKVAAGMLKKPLRTFANNLVQMKLRQWQKQNPELYEEAMALVSGKTDEQLRAIAAPLSKELGIDLSQVAGMFGYKL